MTRFTMVLFGAAVAGGAAQASWLFPKGVGNYGPYTGGHGYSYATAYHYGFAWSAADTWNRDPFAYPGGILPYRPYGRPISKTVFPHPDTPYISVPGENGLYTLVKPSAPPIEGVMTAPMGAPILQPVPAATADSCASIKVTVPANAQVWVEKEKNDQTAGERVYKTAPLTPGQMSIITLRAKWNENGRDFEQFRAVGVRAGETAKVTFTSTQP